jgi:hypothetical protein
MTTLDHSTPVNWHACPECGYRMDRATEINGAIIAPKTGDVSLCLKCATLLRFLVTDGGVVSVSKATDEDWAGIAPDQLAVVRFLQRQIKDHLTILN